MSSRSNITGRLPKSCPFTIQEISYHHRDPCDTYLIREHDQYGEFPHIYAKICSLPPAAGTQGGPHGAKKDGEARERRVIVLSDTGCGTSTDKPAFRPQRGDEVEPETWNIRTVLEHTINPGERIPYLIMTTHCHYDHILGIGKLPATSAPTDSSNECCVGSSAASLSERPDECRRLSKCGRGPASTVLTSARGRHFVTPYSNLQRHSLCGTVGLCAPRYEVGMWAEDMSQVVYDGPSPTSVRASPGHAPIPTPFTILHTPGHTPDSLSWYDSSLRLVCVGDSFYTKESPSTRDAPWGAEPPMPTMFDIESDLKDWWSSLDKVLVFVRERNGEIDHQLADGFVLVDDHADVEVEEPGAPNQGTTLEMPTSHLRRPSRWGRATQTSPTQAQTGFDLPPPGQRIFSLRACRILADDDCWTEVVFAPDERRPPPGRRPRVRLCAAHTTLSVDAESAILAIRGFVAALLRDEIPKKRIEDGSRGEERWLWEYTLDPNRDPARRSTSAATTGQGRQDRSGLVFRHDYSVLAPLLVIQEGRKRIPEEEWR